ncbi:uncharacterized protein LOC131938174 [Physella acuta]|uniref:uncharacterized protein LOC131938174 n=1 Tax=Physella acuta TaxID=109671 RepID=UPI0027DC678C|nr:uncharacterized protein LOC131938174 [Physella acuta]
MGCVQTLTDQAGSITTPNYPEPYPNDASCSWTITVAANQIIDLRFASFDTEASCYDYVKIYDGPSAITTPIGTYCGFMDSNKINSFLARSTGNKMFIEFKSDSSRVLAGFSATYRAHECKSFTYGPDNCENACTCVQNNTRYCNNLNGVCYCKPGFSGSNCEVDFNECSDPNICEDPYSTCNNTKTGYECLCKPGFEKNETTGECYVPMVMCRQSNCKTKICSHGCGLTSALPPVEQCSCPKGMKLDSVTQETCTNCSDWTYGEDCRYSCTCNTANTEYCNKVNGLCNCKPEWTSPTCSEDVNECGFSKSPCTHDHSICRNLVGSYECLCVPGYRVINTTLCGDCGEVFNNESGQIDSGRYLEAHTSIQLCNWTIKGTPGKVISIQLLSWTAYWYDSDSIQFYSGSGSNSVLFDNVVYYDSWSRVIRTTSTEVSIRLQKGSYNRNSPTFLAKYLVHDCPEDYYDFNCSTPCSCVKSNTQSCVSTTGACNCKPGWSSTYCSQDIDECNDPLACPDYSNCINTPGSFRCECKEGMQMVNGACVVMANAVCTATSTRNCSHVCVSITPITTRQLTAICYCPIGKEVDDDGNTCVDCKNFRYGPDCLRQCSCVRNNSLSCNTRQGYCNCKPTFEGSDCNADVDECFRGTYTCPENTTCTNTYGGYKCDCDYRYGYYESKNGSCPQLGCAFKLTNSTGTITSPNPTYQQFRNANCIWDITVDTKQVVSLRISSYRIYSDAKCTSAYFEVYDGNTTGRLIGRYCQTIPDILRTRKNKMTIVYKNEYTYYDFHGYFTGTYISHVCPSFYYGTSLCDTKCRCVKENSQYCDNISGMCVCKQGWTGSDCSLDVNECLGTNNKYCPPNSNCSNTVGSYSCVCHLGYVMKKATQTCEASKECVIKKCSHGCYIKSVGVEVCTCPEGLVLDNSTQQYCVVPYYPYGEMAKDSLLNNSATDLQSYLISEPIYFESAAPFSGNAQPAAYVMSNGVFGFGSKPMKISGFSDLDLANQQGQNLVAPYWADMDTTKGKTYYHVYEKSGSLLWEPDEKGSPQRNTVLERATKDIMEFYSLYGFGVTKVLVITWENVQPFGFLENKTNTIQAIYVSGWETVNKNGRDTFLDFETSYAIFIYQQEKMNWNYQKGRPISIGASNNKKVFDDLDTEIVTSLDKIPGNTGTGYNGVNTVKIGEVSNSDTKCNQYIYTKAYLLSDPVFQYKKDKLYKCPCTVQRLGHQWRLYEKRGDNKDIHCYVISEVAKRRLLSQNNMNMLCCYKVTEPENFEWKTYLKLQQEATYIPPSPESGHILTSDPWSQIYSENLELWENLQAKDRCCKNSSKTKYCDWFYHIFSDKGCSFFVEWVPISALGDPSITTLDGVTYAMNGWGEYHLMEIPSENFTLQARTERTVDINGTLTNATVFTGFAAKESNETTVQILLSTSNKTMELSVNGIDITADFYSNEDDHIVSTTSLQVTREIKMNRTVAVVTFVCGVTIQVHVAVRSLTIVTEVPIDLQGETKGLLGNFNGNMTDEFILPDGVVLSANLTERELFQQFSQAWVVTTATSVFSYKEGESTSSYQHPEFIPMFRDEADPAEVDKAKEICGDNDACIFDFMATGDVAFAESTKEFSEEMQALHKSLANNIPTLQVRNSSLSSSGRWLVQHGVQSTIQLVAEDGDGDNITYEIVGNVSDVIVGDDGVLTYKPDSKNPILLQVRAKDSADAYSPVVFIPVTVCPTCSGHGICNVDITREEEFFNGRFQILTCDCFPAYTGDDCESELDACANEPCSKGQDCTDLTAAEQGNDTIGYTCGVCPIGFKKLNGRCVDIDECSNKTICEQVCTNTEGSFLCSCQAGYRQVLENGGSCSDINECAERTSKCQQNCTNTKGSYSCSCQPGYTLDTNGFTCTMDSKNQELCYQCQQVCQVNNEQVTCSCRLGYEVDPDDNSSCIDTNECLSVAQPCSQNCTNLEGSFQCSCNAGYKLATDGVTCTACKQPYYGENCSSICQCSGHGNCSSVTGCVCDKNWTGKNCELDVDECKQPNACPEGFVCKNTFGSYSCDCPSGFVKENGSCVDFDECKDIYTNTICDKTLEVCVNTVGNYSCSCKPGYARNAQNVCEDIDECKKKTDKCQHICENIPGSYNCMCWQGYYLSEDWTTCIKVRDPCQGMAINCSYGCSVSASKVATCLCPRGFILKEGNLCEDINECLNDTDNECTLHSSCVNTDGSYTCSCSAGTMLDNDGRTCIACSGGTWGFNCNQTCSCSSGSDHCDAATGCVCKSGYTGALCNVDINECVTGDLVCNSSTEVCVNLPGNATCECQSGYSRTGDICADIDECLSPSTNNCSQQCNNTAGGFNCSCFPGFTYNSNNNTCSDIDECLTGTSKCDQNCTNTEGSYTCSCTPGWSLDANGLTCKDVDECVLSTSNCQQKCTNNVGSYTCSCYDGYAVSSQNASECQDEDECLTKTSKCDQNCTNTEGSYTCSCTTGWSLDVDGLTCKDTDECALSTSNCQQNCTNTVGSYTCSCNDGYVVSSQNASECHGTSTHNVQITFQMDVSELELEDVNSTDYKTLKQEVESHMFKRLHATGLAILDVKVKKMSGLRDTLLSKEILCCTGALLLDHAIPLRKEILKGSLITDLAALIDKVLETNPEKALKISLQLAIGEVSNLNNKSSVIIDITVESNPVYASTCELRNRTNPCKGNERCSIENGSTVCRVEESSYLQTLLGLSIGLPAATIILIVSGLVIYYCCKKMSRKNKIFI